MDGNPEHHQLTRKEKQAAKKAHQREHKAEEREEREKIEKEERVKVESQKNAAREEAQLEQQQLREVADKEKQAIADAKQKAIDEELAAEAEALAKALEAKAKALEAKAKAAKKLKIAEAKAKEDQRLQDQKEAQHKRKMDRQAEVLKMIHQEKANKGQGIVGQRRKIDWDHTHTWEAKGGDGQGQPFGTFSSTTVLLYHDGNYEIFDDIGQQDGGDIHNSQSVTQYLKGTYEMAKIDDKIVVVNLHQTFYRCFIERLFPHDETTSTEVKDLILIISADLKLMWLEKGLSHQTLYNKTDELRAAQAAQELKESQVKEAKELAEAVAQTTIEEEKADKGA